MMTTKMTPVTASGDAELVNASLAGNREAFGQIVSRYQSLVCSLAYSATGSLSQSEDLAQETFLAAWKHLADLDEPPKLRAWLCGIARNLICNSLRTLGREPSYRAESLEAIPESRSPEPLPVERAISQEEAEILWRSLERIPETYRVPLVLFYREHQSIETVAQSLELTEEAVRQRLSRGRKLLQEEVLAFVESALERTSPGRAFTVAVVATLPTTVTSAKAASLSAAVAKGGVAAKGIFSLTALAGLLSMLGAVVFSWKTSVDDSKSLRERKFMVRMARYQVVFFAVSLVVSFCCIPVFSNRPWVFAPALALLVLANVANGAMVMPYLVRRRLEIGAEEGTLADTLEDATRDRVDRPFQPPGSGLENDASTEVMSGRSAAAARPAAIRRTIKLTIPFLIMFVGMAIALPWRQHWIRCVIVMAAEALVILWFFRRMLRLLNGQSHPSSPRGPAFMWNPFIRTSVILFGTVLFAGIGGFLLPLFLNPEAARPEILYASWLGPLGVCCLLAVLAYAAFAALFLALRRKSTPSWKWLARILDLPFLQQLPTMTHGPDAVVEMTYAPLFQQLNLGPDQRMQLKDLVLKRTMVGVRAGMSLMNWKLDAANRAALTREMKRETDGLHARTREFLGEEHYAVFQQYEKSIPDRTLLNGFSSRSAKTAAALTPEQHARLLQALTEARAQYPWTTEFSRRNQDASDYAALFTEDNLRTFARQEEQFDRQFLVQAQQILNPEQLAAFEKAQERQRRSQVAQLNVAAKLFAPKNR